MLIKTMMQKLVLPLSDSGYKAWVPRGQEIEGGKNKRRRNNYFSQRHERLLDREETDMAKR